MSEQERHNPRRSVSYSRAFEEVTVGLRRMKVPGGWLVNGFGDAVVYVPDPNYTWIFNVEPGEETNVENNQKSEGQ